MMWQLDHTGEKTCNDSITCGIGPSLHIDLTHGQTQAQPDSILKSFTLIESNLLEVNTWQNKPHGYVSVRTPHTCDMWNMT